VGVTIAAALAFWDEPVEFLERLVASLVGQVDVLVAVDGRWDGMPGMGALSPVEQGEALRAGSELGLDVITIAGGEECWESQVAKRSALMAIASEVADWVFVVDGDEELVAEPGLRSRLAETGAASGGVSIVAMNRPWPYRDLARMIFRSRRLFRAGTTVSGRHDGYEFDGQPIADLLTLDLTDCVTIRHDNLSRPAARLEAAQTYRRVRRRERLEVLA
jgi:hypothetical protein